MYLILLIFFLTTATSVLSEPSDEEIRVVNDLKIEIASNCFKCYAGSQAKIQSAKDKLEIIIKETKNTDLKASAYEVLGDAYGELAGYTSNSKNKSEEYLNKRNSVYFKAFELNRCKSPELISKSLLKFSKLSSDKQLELLKPIIVKQQELLFKLKYREGLLLLGNKKTDEGIQALELAVDLSNSRDAEYSAEKIAEILFNHKKNKKAFDVLRKKYPVKVTNDELLMLLKKQ